MWLNLKTHLIQAIIIEYKIIYKFKNIVNAINKLSKFQRISNCSFKLFVGLYTQRLNRN